ncbi:hypothetical protein CDAR_615901 [Caerostris darwini]|uniref:Uncharacterized protein n=1 Tax=Caerostris darwini TaxID=1538125 RepID=A0AAV4RXY7_9ARAC|nr:hypothetical protein CDAR_615901 [Caerostris darwini]
MDYIPSGKGSPTKAVPLLPLQHLSDGYAINFFHLFSFIIEVKRKMPHINLVSIQWCRLPRRILALNAHFAIMLHIPVATCSTTPASTQESGPSSALCVLRVSPRRVTLNVI